MLCRHENLNDFKMIKAYKIYTGPNGHTHITIGSVGENRVTTATSVRFKETPPHFSFDWHPAPVNQYVISITGTLLFETWLGETFILKPGDVLIAMDTTGTGHKWKLIDDEPWKRVYIAFGDSEINFLEEQ